MPLILANTIAFLVANGINFLVAHLWVFKRTLKDVNLSQKYIAVLLVSLVGLALNDVIVWGGVIVLETGIVVTKIIATAVAWLWNYQARAVWIYGKG